MSVTEEYKAKPMDDGDFEIRLTDVLQWLSESRRTLAFWAAGAFIVGAIYAFLIPDEFTTSVRVMPELRTQTSAGGLGDLKSLAGLAGVNLDNSMGGVDAIRPDLYPDMLASVPFALFILRQPVYSAQMGKTVTLEDYLNWHYNQTFIGRVRTFFNSLFVPKAGAPGVGPVNRSRAMALTEIQEVWAIIVYSRISATIDKKSGIITIAAQMPDPVVAGTVGQQTLEYLTKYVTEYRTGKARQQVRFLEQQVRNARQRYESAEYTLSAYRDRNRSIYLNTAKIEEQRLQGDYLLAQNVYNELSKQLEQARIKVQEEAPVFQTLDPARVPVTKSGPKRLVIIIAFTIFGGLVGLSVFFFRRFISRKPTRFV